MNILITGKSGTVGSNLEFGVGFSKSKYDLRNIYHVKQLMADLHPDAIVHCAANVGGLDEHLKFKKKLFYDNIVLNTNLIESALQHKVPRVLSFLSSCIYSNDATQPYNETNIHVGEPFPDYYPYGFAKRMLEVQSRICYEEFGFKYNCVVPTNIYGVNDNFNINTGHVIGVLIHKAYLSKQNNADFMVWGDGNQEREYLFTEDVAKLTKWCLENYLDKTPIVFSNNIKVKIKDVAQIIYDKFQLKNKLIFNTDKPGGQKNRSLDGSKLHSLYKIDFTSIDIGINKTIDWFLENYPNVRC